MKSPIMFLETSQTDRGHVRGSISFFGNKREVVVWMMEEGGYISRVCTCVGWGLRARHTTVSAWCFSFESPGKATSVQVCTSFGELRETRRQTAIISLSDYGFLRNTAWEHDPVE
jgi:hypothetical protein